MNHREQSQVNSSLSHGESSCHLHCSKSSAREIGSQMNEEPPRSLLSLEKERYTLGGVQLDPVVLQHCHQHIVPLWWLAISCLLPLIVLAKLHTRGNPFIFEVEHIKTILDVVAWTEIDNPGIISHIPFHWQLRWCYIFTQGMLPQTSTAGHGENCYLPEIEVRGSRIFERELV